MKTFLLLLGSAFFVGCHAVAGDSLLIQREQPFQRASVVTTNANLHLGISPILSPWLSQRLGDSHRFVRIHIPDSLHGWSATSDGILFTTESNNRWRQISAVPMPKDAYLTDLFCLDSANAWISLSKTELHFDESTKEGSYDIAAWLMKTTDQGRTWQSNFTFEGVQILQMLFDDDEGWAVGRRLSRNGSETDSNFVVHTTDQGKSWKDISTSLPADTGVYKITSLGSAKVAVITGNGFLYSTTDGGSSWDRRGSYADEYAEVTVHRLDMNRNHHLCVLGGSGGLEGTLSVLACGDTNSSWKRRVLDGVFLNDAIFLADGRLLACGFIVKENDPIGVGGEAAILVSADEGANWSVVYRNPEVKSLNALTATDPHHIWAVGSQGLIVQLGPN
jgi:photosystem II stability/assembly factor-like uncharacterized protein